MKKKTHEEYVEELAIKNPTVEVVEEYNGANTKIMHHCLNHDVYWMITPHNALSGHGCEACHKENVAKKRTKSNEEYIEELKSVNQNIIPIETYVNSKTKILHKCLIHNIEWYVTPDDVLSGNGCYKCKGEKIKNALSKTHDQYIEEIKIKNPNIIIVGKYNGANNPTLHKCLIHNIEFNITPVSVLAGSGCEECHKEKIGMANKKSQDEYIKELETVNKNIKLVGNYINNITPTMYKCLIHNVEFENTPACILRGYGCPECKKEKLRNYHLKTHDQYVKEVEAINKNIIVVGKYISANTPIKHKCTVCGNEWDACPTNILRGSGCNYCIKSKGEKDIASLLDDYGIEYVEQKRFYDCCDIRELPFDFYLPTFNVVIEYNGKQHYEPIEYFGGNDSFDIQQKHDKIKKDYCINNNIKFLEIRYDEDIKEKLNNFLFI